MTKQEYNKLIRKRSDVISHNRFVRMSGRGNPKPVPTKPERPQVLQAFDDDGYIGTFPISWSKTKAEQTLRENGYILDTVRFKQVDAN